METTMNQKDNTNKYIAYVVFAVLFVATMVGYITYDATHTVKPIEGKTLNYYRMQK